MNFKFYILGNPDDYAQFPLDNTRVLYQRFVQEKQANDRLIIYHDGMFVYHTYLLQLENKENYFGICLVINGLFCGNAKKLFYFLKEQVHKNIVLKGKILQIDEWGKISFATDTFTSKQIEVEIDRIKGIIVNEITTRLKNDFIPIHSDIIDKNEEVVIVPIDDDDIDIDKAVQKHKYTMVTPSGTTYLQKPAKKKGHC